MHNRRLREIQRDIRPEQGGEFLNEFATEFLFPTIFFGCGLLLTFLVWYT